VIVDLEAAIAQLGDQAAQGEVPVPAALQQPSRDARPPASWAGGMFHCKDIIVAAMRLQSQALSDRLA
jgi:hypothetical protein